VVILVSREIGVYDPGSERGKQFIIGGFP